MKNYKYYYFDEQNDDFANNGIDTKPTPKDFQYLPKNIFYRIFKPIAYYFFLIFFAIAVKAMGVSFVNKKVLKDRKDKSKGYFIYGNHTSWIPDTVSAAMAAFPKQCYTIANPDAISIPCAGTLVQMFGAMPTPSSIQNYKDLNKALVKLYDKGMPISIFPEAHIWPHYNKIRNFPSVSFAFPVSLDAPSFTKTMVYRQKPNGKIKPVIIFDGPFYPDKSLNPRAAKEELRNRIYETMVRRVEENNSTLAPNYEYIRVDTPEEVRSDITEIQN